MKWPWTIYGLAIILGALYPFGLSPFHLPIITLLSPIAWATLCFDKRNNAFITGWLFGTALFLTGLHWLTISLSHAGGLSPLLSWMLILLLAMLLGLTHGSLAWLYHKIKFHPTLAPIGFASLWVLGEIARTHVLSGLPCLLMANTYTDTPWAPWIAILGPYGITWFTLALLLGTFDKITRNTNLAWLIFFLITALALQEKTWTQPQPPTPPIVVVQSNFTVDEKWHTPNQVLVQELLEMSRGIKNAWLIWPEGALMGPSKQLVHDLDRWSQQNKQILIAGLTSHQHNIVISFPSPHQIYYKQYLVAFGEYNPLPDFITAYIQRYLPTIPFSNLKPGPLQSPLYIKKQAIAAALCYDILFPSFIEQVTEDTGWILTLTEDNWFGKSWAAWQHLQAARMRSLETGRPALFVNDAGPSAHIDAHGQIIKQSKAQATTLLQTQLTPHTGHTPYMRYGHKLAMALIALYLSTLFAHRYYRK